MDRPSRAGETISRTFFISQLVAIGLVGLTAAVADLSANDTLLGLLLIAGIAAMVWVVWGLRLPAKFATKFSPGVLSFGAILFSVFAAVLSYQDAAGFGDLPADLLARPTVQILRLGGTLAFGAFALALLANLIATAVALRSPKQPGA
jgi:hypothetical protein